MIVQIDSFDKIRIFYVIRGLIGIFSAYGKAKFVYSIQSIYGVGMMKLLTIFLLFSPGIFYCSTAFLPSATAMTIVMLSYASFLNNNYIISIFWGSLAVLWLGWPFIAVLFLPIGIYMIAYRYANNGFYGVIILLVQGFLMAIAVAIPSILIDIYYYQKITFPPLNILLYNSLGGSGDELYGIEPASYYYSNLILNLGILWPIACSTPLVVMRNYLKYNSVSVDSNHKNKITLMLMIPTIVWVGILLNRPHKEERFMYPIYPLIAFLATYTILSTCDLVGGLVSAIFNETHSLSIYDLLDDDDREYNKTTILKSKNTTRFKFSIIAVIILIFFSMGFSRIASNNFNYGGYINLWKDMSEIIMNDSNYQKLHICTGGEWYYFPSHFFLPKNAQLDYVYDNFHGQLPQYFAKENGTFSEPSQPFNDKNKEEKSRYIAVDKCDYLVASIPDYTSFEIERLIESFRNVEKIIIKDTHIWKSIKEHQVIDPIKSTSSLTRAFFIPGLSNTKNKFKKYAVYKNVQKNTNEFN